MNIYRDIKREIAIQRVERLVLRNDGRPLSPGQARYRAENLPQRFQMLDDDRSLPVTISGHPCWFGGHPCPPIEANAIDQRYLIMGQFLYIDHEALLYGKSPIPRRVYAARAYLTLRELGFRYPRTIKGALRLIRAEVKEGVQS